tara:strand:- start:662 stop:1060 length:399 start_codon:yes stop_codon:yes gene_type:complete
MKKFNSTLELIKHFLTCGYEINLHVNFNADGRGKTTISQKIFNKNTVLESPINYTAYLKCLEYLDSEIAEIYIEMVCEDESLDFDDLSSSFDFSIKSDNLENLELHFLNGSKVKSNIPFELLNDNIIYRLNI